MGAACRRAGSAGRWWSTRASWRVNTCQRCSRMNSGTINSLDLLVRTLYLVFPPLEWSVLTLIGMPNGCGKIALYPLWMKYWRDRVFACDEYAARLGQRYQLVRALDELKWARDGGAATGGGRWLRDTPYIESRIDRLMLYRGLQQ